MKKIDLEMTSSFVVLVLLVMLSSTPYAAAEAPVLSDMGECVGANSKLAVADRVNPSTPLPDDPESGWVDEPDLGMLGLFLFQYESDGIYWYEFSGKTAVWERCDGVTLYSDAHVSTNLPQ